jgi:putative FmdB family regulatory protein
VPTYQYACTEADCGHVFEQFQSFSEDSLTVCPQCDGRLRKVFNAVGVVFKGSGFYRTDSRTADKANGKGSDSTSGAGKSETATPGSGSTSSSSSNGSSNGTSSTSSSTSSTATAGAGAA